MSFIDTDGRSSRFLTRAQNLAITSESAPRSSKKWSSTGTRSARITSASISARMLLGASRRIGGRGLKYGSHYVNSPGQETVW